MKLHNPKANITDPNQSLQLLKEGNERFIKNGGMPRNTNEADRIATKDSQHPFAAIVTCADSRCSPELFFDQKIGDIFVLRNAGNVADNSVKGSLEFAVAVLKVPLVVVVGHTQCGAVYNAQASATGLPQFLQAHLDDIGAHLNKEAGPADCVDQNVAVQVAALKENPVLKEAGAMVVGASYDIETGVVKYL